LQLGFEIPKIADVEMIDFPTKKLREGKQMLGVENKCLE